MDIYCKKNEKLEKLHIIMEGVTINSILSVGNQEQMLQMLYLTHD